MPEVLPASRWGLLLMAHSKETRAITSHLWTAHDRTRAEGTTMARELLHEEIHATAQPGELNHEHGPNGEFVVVCACGASHECTVLAPKGE